MVSTLVSVYSVSSRIGHTMKTKFQTVDPEICLMACHTAPSVSRVMDISLVNKFHCLIVFTS